MNKENLVILKGKSTLVAKDGTRLFNTTPYRCIEVDRDKKGKNFLVYGVLFDELSFNQLFEFLHTVVMNEFKKIGLVKENGSAISKKEFKEQASIHQYGRGKHMLNVLYFYSHPKECIYGFYPQLQGDSKAECLTNAYRMYINLLNGEMDDFDCDEIQRGNCGIPIGYGNLRTQREFVDKENEILV